jgi:hypothetical protein
MKIGLFSLAGTETDSLRRRLEQEPSLETAFFDLSLHQGAFSMDAGQMRWNGIDLTQLDIAWLLGFNYQNPVIPAPLPRGVEWSVWQDQYLADQQSFSALFSLFDALSRQGVRVLNAPRVQIAAFQKFALLEQLRQHGLHIPELIATNHPDAAQSFMRTHETVIWRPVTGKAAWQRFTERQRQALINPLQPPVLLASVQPGPLVRSYVLGGQPILTVNVLAPQAEPYNESLEHLVALADTPHAAMLSTLSQHLGLEWAMVSYVDAPTGPFIYDVDVEPLWGWLPPVHQETLLDTLAAALLPHKQQHPMDPLAFNHPYARTNLFLRRMLRILFQFEESKYPPGQNAKKR